MRKLFGFWSLRYPVYLTYMLQASEYQPAEYISWWARTRDFRTVMKRRKLESTPKARLIKAGLTIMYLAGLLAIMVLSYIAAEERSLIWAIVALGMVFAWPVVMAFSILGVLWVGETIIQRPKERKQIALATQKATTIKAHKIAVAGSYGKTSMKEMLLAVLSVGRNVRATPGNKNTLAGNSQFINDLSGQEDIVIFEFGESHVGDVDKLCQLTGPQLGIITGVSEAHLDTFGSKENLVGTIYELVDYLGDDAVYKNADSEYIRDHIVGSDKLAYSKSGVNGWKVSEVEASLEGIKFTAQKADHLLHLSSRLIGEHHIGPLMACVDIAHKFGLSDEQVVNGVAQTTPFEHRMQPYKLHGATVIDDTYNGNPAGIYSGLALLKQAPARRRVYVTPGLVGLGEESAEIHKAIGQEIGRSADVVVLMKNSTTPFLRQGIESGEFKGTLMIVEEPLEFYQNLDQFVAAGDVVLMQNDWTDNYA